MEIVNKIVSNPFRSSVESTDQDTSSGSKKDVRVSSFESSVDADAVAGIQRDTSRVTIASSLGHSMESSDPEASVGTYSGSECSRRDISHVTASTASLGKHILSSFPPIFSKTFPYNSCIYFCRSFDGIERSRRRFRKNGKRERFFEEGNFFRWYG